MKLSCITFTFPLLAMEQAAAIFKILGFEYIDIIGYTKAPFDAITPWDIQRDPKAMQTKFEAVTTRHGFRPNDYFFTFGEGFTDRPVNTPNLDLRAENRDVFRHVVAFCRKNGLRHITMLPGVIWDDLGPDRSLELASDALRELVDIAGEAGLPVGIEPHLQSVSESIPRTQQLLAMTKGLTLTLDYTHFIAQDIRQNEIDVLAPHASHFHARQGAPGRLQAGMDDGTIDYPAVARTLKRAGYDGFLTLEYSYQSWQGCDKTENVSETIRLMEQLVAAM